jgi:hypothetical protein
MRIREAMKSQFFPAIASKSKVAILFAIVAAMFLLGQGCSRPEGLEAIDTDANGYVCQRCGAKFYTPRKVFLDSKCPKCGQDSLNEVVGFLCNSDHHLTLRARAPGLPAMSVCEHCKAVLKNALFLPREKDLKAWGAVPFTP